MLVGTSDSFSLSSKSKGLRRPNRRGPVVVGVVLLIVALVAGTFAFVVSRSSGGLSGKTASQVLVLSMTAARAKGSVRYHVTSSGAGAGSQTFDVGRSGGTQNGSFGANGAFTLRVTTTAAYLNADAAFLENAIGLSSAVASVYAGRWVSFTAGDASYSSLVSGDTLSSALNESTPTGALSLTPVRTLNGQQVVGVRGGLPSDTAQGATGSQTLYVSTSSPYLPVALQISGSLGGQSGSSIGTFSRWGENVPVTAPSGSIPVSQLTSAPSPNLNDPAWTLAKEVSFQTADFPAGTVIEPADPAGPHLMAPTPPGPCSPLSSAPWLADWDSPTFDPSGPGNAADISTVFVMDSGETALQAQHAISIPGYDAECIQPSWDQTIANDWQTTQACGTFTVDKSSIGPGSTVGLPQASVAFRYLALVTCRASQQHEAFYVDIVYCTVGSVFMKGTFVNFASPTDVGIEQRAMNDMASRAYRLIEGYNGATPNANA